MSSSNYVSLREKKIDALITKMFGDKSPDLAVILKADLMSKDEFANSPDLDEQQKEMLENDLIERNKPLLAQIRAENEIFACGIGQLQMTYNEMGQLHTITQLPVESSSK